MLAAATKARPPNAPRGAGPALKAQYAAGRALCRLLDGELQRARSSLSATRGDLARVGAAGLVEGLDTLIDDPSRRRRRLLGTPLGRDSDARGLWLRALAV